MPAEQMPLLETKLPAEDSPGSQSEAPRDTASKAPKWMPANPQFSPTQVDLPILLQLVITHRGDCGALRAAIRSAFFADKASSRTMESERDQQQLALARNSITSLANYRVLTLADCEPTEIGLSLSKITDREQQLRALAAHILNKLGGLDLLLAVRRIQTTRRSRRQGGRWQTSWRARAMSNSRGMPRNTRRWDSGYASRAC